MKTFKDLFDHLRSAQYNSVYEFLEEPWVGKEKQECVFILMALAGTLHEFNGFKVCVGNFDKKTIKPIQEARDILKKSLNSKGDKSDLTLIKGNKVIASSSKNLRTYNIGDLDIEKICCVFDIKYKETHVLQLCLMIPDKEYFYRMLNNIESNNEYLLDVCNNAIVLDHKDLNKALLKFNDMYKDNEFIDLNRKPPLCLYFHQELSINKFFRANEAGHYEILLGCIPRSGKSYILAGIISYLEGDQLNFLIITTCPKETIQQYVDIFETYREFNDYGLFVLSGSNKKPRLGPKNIIICSQQYLKNGKNGIKNIKWLKELDIDILMSDETHNGGTTELSKKIINTYRGDATILYITATYSKPIEVFDIPKEAHILWDLEDVNLCKTINKRESLMRLTEKHECKEEIEKYSDEEIMARYSKYPEFHIMTTRFNDITEAEIKEYTKGNSYGWSTEGVLLLKQNETVVIDEFQNDDAVANLFYLIFGKYDKFGAIIQYKDNILARIYDTFVKNPSYNTRWFNEEEPLIIMCFLPNEDRDLDTLMKAIKKLLIKKNIVPDFEIDYINSNRSEGPMDVINNAYALTKNNNKKGLLILSGRQCSLGVSIHNCDIVINLNNSKSYDLYMQMAFRGMTEAPNKKCGFLIDMNIQRVVSNMVNEGNKLYPDGSIKESIRRVLNSNTININTDEFKEYFTITDKIYHIYNTLPESNLDNILKFLNFKETLFSADDQALFNSLFTVSGSHKELRAIIEDLTSPQDINTGIVEVSAGAGVVEVSAGAGVVEERIKEEKQVKLVQDVIKHIIPLISILTIGVDKMSFIEIMGSIRDQPQLSVIFVEQLQKWWGDKISPDVINILIILYNKYCNNYDELKIKIKLVKDKFMLSLGDKKELSQNIDRYLIPQDIEKKTNAEVSTPYNLRQDMLNLIPEDFWKSKRKVLEPCSGKGGFLIDLVDRFLTGGLDYKTIVEKCLYFADINSTNIFICKLLLDPYNEYKLNVYKGDTLNMEFKDNFDLVIGNPPYNMSGNVATGNTIWQHFTKLALNKWMVAGGYLLFVHPAGWRKPESEKSKNKGLFKLMTYQNQMIHLSIHGLDDGKKTFNCGTRYDFYLICRRPADTLTTIRDEQNNTYTIDLRRLEWLPNYSLNDVLKLVATGDDARCPIIYSANMYETRRPHVSSTKDKLFKYTLIHSTPQSGVRYMYSNVNDRGHFGVKKVIFGEAGINNVIVDMNGIYGMTQGAMAIQVDTIEEAESIKKCLLSSKFKEILNPCLFGNFRVDWRLFTFFKKDFWCAFI